MSDTLRELTVKVILEGVDEARVALQSLREEIELAQEKMDALTTPQILQGPIMLCGKEAAAAMRAAVADVDRELAKDAAEALHEDTPMSKLNQVIEEIITTLKIAGVSVDEAEQILMQARLRMKRSAKI